MQRMQRTILRRLKVWPRKGFEREENLRVLVLKGQALKCKDAKIVMREKRKRVTQDRNFREPHKIRRLLSSASRDERKTPDQFLQNSSETKRRRSPVHQRCCNKVLATLLHSLDYSNHLREGVKIPRRSGNRVIETLGFKSLGALNDHIETHREELIALLPKTVSRREDPQLIFEKKIKRFNVFSQKENCGEGETLQRTGSVDLREIYPDL